MFEFSSFLIIFVFIYLVFSIKIVPQGEEWVVERLGRFQEVMPAGLNFVIPFIDNVRYVVVTKDIILDIPTQEAITKDNAVILANAIAFIKVTNIQKAVYGVESFKIAMKNIIQTNLRSIIGGLDLNEALSSRDRIRNALKDSITDEAAEWGITVKTVEIQDIKPSENMQKAMEAQASAERSRVAVITQAEGDKQATILKAEATLEAARKEAEAQTVAADASAKAINTISNAIKASGVDSSHFLIADRYVSTLGALSLSDNAKVVVMPHDISAAAKSLIGEKL